MATLTVGTVAGKGPLGSCAMPKVVRFGIGIANTSLAARCRRSCAYALDARVTMRRKRCRCIQAKGKSCCADSEDRTHQVKLVLSVKPHYLKFLIHHTHATVKSQKSSQAKSMYELKCTCTLCTTRHVGHSHLGRADRYFCC
jgi:hypothetical protein